MRVGCNPGDSCDAHARKTVSARKCLNGLYAAELGHNSFIASNGWLEKWQKRHNIRMGVLSGEAADVDPSVSDWGVRLKSICNGYALEVDHSCKPSRKYNTFHTYYPILPIHSHRDSFHCSL